MPWWFWPSHRMTSPLPTPSASSALREAVDPVVELGPGESAVAVDDRQAGGVAAAVLAGHVGEREGVQQVGHARHLVAPR